jgi:hypothetical protein
LETELEEKLNTSQKELQDLQQKSEETLTVLRNFYEEEKDNLNKKIRDEKE